MNDIWAPEMSVYFIGPLEKEYKVKNTCAIFHRAPGEGVQNEQNAFDFY
jgi:hypothetical protein